MFKNIFATLEAKLGDDNSSPRSLRLRARAFFFTLRRRETASSLSCPSRLTGDSLLIRSKLVPAPSTQGVSRTKAKKQAKLKRQMASIRKAGRREEGNNGEARFAAMQLVNDPQAFAEHLFGRLQSGSALKFDTKMLLIQVVSRVVGLHRLHLLHLYPFLQRYVQPNQREVTRLLASAATACHELVPPDALEPLLRQLVNQFVHDRARPEVVAVGINTVREICVRCPLVMHSDLLQDLAQYKRARDKPVATAARALIALFRELAPGMLEKKDRGKGAFHPVWVVTFRLPGGFVFVWFRAGSLPLPLRPSAFGLRRRRASR